MQGMTVKVQAHAAKLRADPLEAQRVHERVQRRADPFAALEIPPQVQERPLDDQPIEHERDARAIGRQECALRVRSR